MTNKRVTKLIQQDSYLAKVDVTLIETDSEWSPYYSLDDVRRLDAVRQALKDGDLEAAKKLALLFRLEPVTD